MFPVVSLNHAKSGGGGPPTPDIGIGEPLVYEPRGGNLASLSRRTRVERAIRERDGCGCCFYCGKPHAECLDHVRARKKGGSDAIDNLVLACRNCNFEKSTAPAWYYVFRLYAKRLPARKRRVGLVRFVRHVEERLPIDNGAVRADTLAAPFSTPRQGGRT